MKNTGTVLLHRAENIKHAKLGFSSSALINKILAPKEHVPPNLQNGGAL